MPSFADIRRPENWGLTPIRFTPIRFTPEKKWALTPIPLWRLKAKPDSL